MLTIQRLIVNRGDTLVLKVAGHLSQACAIGIRDQLKASFPGQRVLVLEDDLDLAVIKNPSHPKRKSSSRGVHSFRVGRRKR